MIFKLLRRFSGIPLMDVFTYKFGDFKIHQFLLRPLSVFSYLLIANRNAILIDPILFQEQYQEYAKKSNAQISLLLLTHLHSDYKPCLKIPSAQTVIHKNAKIDAKKIDDMDKIIIEDMQIQLIHTPGHSTQSSCYFIKFKQHKFLFTGDTVLMNSVGSPYSDNQEDKSRLLGQLYDSLGKLKKLDQKTLVFPGHGQDSACGKIINNQNYSTLGYQFVNNIGFNAKQRHKFIQFVKKHQPIKPNFCNFENNKTSSKRAISFQNIVLNKFTIIDIQPFPQDIQQTQILISPFAKIYRIPLNRIFQKNVGYFIKKDQTIVIMSKNQQTIDQAWQRLSIIGLNPKGFIQNSQRFRFEMRCKQINFVNAMKVTESLIDHNLIDVRSLQQQRIGNIQNSKKIEMHKLRDQIQTLDKQKKYIIHCKSGARALYCGMIMQSHGFNIKICNDDVKKIIQFVQKS